MSTACPRENSAQVYLRMLRKYLMDHCSVEQSRFPLGAKLGMLLQRVLRKLGRSEGEEPGQLDRQLDRPKAGSPGSQTRPFQNGQCLVSIHPISGHLESGQCGLGLVWLLVGMWGLWVPLNLYCCTSLAPLPWGTPNPKPSVMINFDCQPEWTEK